jgi:Family of unknown function (DUF5681)
MARHKLAALAIQAAGGEVSPAPAIRLKPGATLSRSWRGQTHTVQVLEEESFEHPHARGTVSTRLPMPDALPLPRCARRPSMARKSGGNYEMGYGRPPLHSHFRPGQSGNPKGRPKSSADLSTLLTKALTETVTINEGGRRRVITKGEAVVKQLTNKAASGDPRAIKVLMELDRRRGSVSNPAGASNIAEQRKPAEADQRIEEYDLASLTTEQLTVLYEAARILEGQQDRPPVPVPPADPGEKP